MIDNDTSIESLGMSVRAVNVLREIGLLTVGAVRSTTDQELRKHWGMGNKTLREIRTATSPVNTHVCPEEMLENMGAIVWRADIGEGAIAFWDAYRDADRVVKLDLLIDIMALIKAEHERLLDEDKS